MHLLIFVQGLRQSLAEEVIPWVYNDVQLVEPVKDTATSEIATDITETPIQHARKRALSGQQKFCELPHARIFVEMESLRC
jgi:glutamate-1-semialdehyde aminotransferase